MRDALEMRRFLKVTAAACAMVLAGCVPRGPEERQIASIHAAGIVGGGASRVEGNRQIESTLTGLTALFRERGFQTSLQPWAREHGKQFNYGYYLTGERIYTDNFTYKKSVEHVLVQTLVSIDRKTAKLDFMENEWPMDSHRFPLPERDRQHVRETARAAADYLRQHLPSHQVELSFETKIH
jgi:hypothetical protein